MTTQQRPEFGKLYGITFSPTTKESIVKSNRVLKVGLGVPKGRAIKVFLANGKWYIQHGVWDKSGGKEKLVMKTVYEGGKIVDGVVTPNTKEAAEKWHNDNKHLAAVSNRPQKVPYFTFSQRLITEDASGKPVETFEPDFDAIAAHGDRPQRIPVMLTSDNPLKQAFEWWTASELKCHGDGIVAERLISVGSAKDPNCQAAKDAGEKFFVYSPCWSGGCPHVDVDCKPHSTLEIQLQYAIRLGTTAYFSSTGQVSANRLFSSLNEIQSTIERMGYQIAGVPMDLVLSSFRANFQGKGATKQPYVSLEVKARGSTALRQLLESAWTPTKLEESPLQLEEAQPLTLDAGAIEISDIDEPEFDDDDPETPPTAASATKQKQDELSQRLRERGSKPNWTSQSSMETLMATIRNRVGVEAFEAALVKHAIPEDLKWDDPKAVALYLDLRLLPDHNDPF